MDIAYIYQNKFWPIEIKWTTQLRSKDLHQVKKYKNSKIVSQLKNFHEIEGIPVEPIPFHLLKLCLQNKGNN